MRDDGPSWDELISRYGLRLTLQAGQLRGPCPLHGGTNPTAFVVNPDRGFYCHACGEGGGIQTFVQLMGGNRAGVRIPRSLQERGNWSKHSPGHLELERLSQSRIRALATLPEVEPIYPRDAKHPYFMRRGLSPTTVASVGGGVYRGEGSFFRRAVFPVWTPDGRLVGHIGRAIDGGNVPRYRCEKGLRKSLLLYNETDALAASAWDGTVIVVEGIFDVLAVLEAGFPNVVALVGCMASSSQLAALARYDRVISLLDGDDAGRDGTRLLRRVLGEKVTIADLPSGDPCETPRAELARLLARSALHPDRRTSG